CPHIATLRGGALHRRIGSMAGVRQGVAAADGSETAFWSAEEKIRIVLEGLRGEDTIAELCRKEGINQNLYYRWSKEFLQAGKNRLAGDTAREATSDEVKELKAEARQLKETLAEVLIENRLLKKSVLGDGEDAS